MTDSDRALASAVDQLTNAVEQLRADLVRKDVYEAQRGADRAEVSELRADVLDIKETMKWLSRTLVISLVVPLLTSALIFYVTQQGAA